MIPILPIMAATFPRTGLEGAVPVAEQTVKVNSLTALSSPLSLPPSSPPCPPSSPPSSPLSSLLPFLLLRSRQILVQIKFDTSTAEDEVKRHGSWREGSKGREIGEGGGRWGGRRRGQQLSSLQEEKLDGLIDEAMTGQPYISLPFICGHSSLLAAIMERVLLLQGVAV
eukprot:759439-Hanusia_phi.AAC.1